MQVVMVLDSAQDLDSKGCPEYSPSSACERETHGMRSEEIFAAPQIGLRGLTVDGLMCALAQCRERNLKAKWQPDECALAQLDKIRDREVQIQQALLQANRQRIADIKRKRDEERGKVMR